MTEISYERSGDYVDKLVDTKTPPNNPARIHPHCPTRHLQLTLADGTLDNDGSATETVTIAVVDGLEVARGTDPADASVLDYNGKVTLHVTDASTSTEVTRTVTAGTASIDISTEQPAGTTITVDATGLADHPAGSDSVDIEVTQA